MLFASAASLAGCGFGPGEDKGTAEMLITRDYGRVLMYRGSEPVRESDDVMRLLTRTTESVETSYGGGYVESIDGYGSSSASNARSDWFFYVDGAESPVGALEARVQPGQSIWWDRRDWSATMHVPAVVGSWPKPFGNHSGEVGVECLMSSEDECAGVVRDLRQTGARVEPEVVDSTTVRVLVGPWSELRRDPVASSLERGPSASGVYARFVPHGEGWRLQSLDSSGDPMGAATRSGLVAALSEDSGRVTWILAGSDRASVPRRLAGEDLVRRYAVVYPAGDRQRPVEVPRP